MNSSRIQTSSTPSTPSTSSFPTTECGQSAHPTSARAAWSPLKEKAKATGYSNSRSSAPQEWTSGSAPATTPPCGSAGSPSSTERSTTPPWTTGCPIPVFKSQRETSSGSRSATPGWPTPWTTWIWGWPSWTTSWRTQICGYVSICWTRTTKFGWWGGELGRLPGWVRKYSLTTIL